MAYAAVISLKQTIHRLLNSSPISTSTSASPKILHVAYKHLTSLQQVLSGRQRKTPNVLDQQIRDVLHQFQDLLESQFPSSHEHNTKEVWQLVTSLVEATAKMEKDCIRESNNPSSSEDDDDDQDSVKAPSRSIESCRKMVGLSDSFSEIKDHVVRIKRPDEFGVFSFLGSAGNGRSLVAKSIYDDLIITEEQSFDCGAWVRIGSINTLEQILQTLIAQTNEPSPNLEGDEELGQFLYASLKGRRYVVVLDDVRKTDTLVQLRRWLPEQNNGSLVFVTTSLMEVAQLEEGFEVIEIPVVFDELLSWSYIRLSLMMFSGGGAVEYEEVGKKIAKNCRGFRMVLAKVILAMLRSEKTTEFWLAVDEDDPIFRVDDEILEASQIKNQLSQNDETWANTLFDVSSLINRVKKFLYPDRFFPKMGIMTLYGMAGIGKTTLVRKVYQDPSILHHFEHRAWVDVGPKYRSEEILVDILAQIYSEIDVERMKEDANLVQDLCTQLQRNKCFIVLDDWWSQEPVRDLKEILPNIKGELVITTRLLNDVARFGPCDRAYKVRFLNREESWQLLREKVFADEHCPPQLEKAGKKIAESCDGLPLLILAVADLLSRSERTLKFWTKVAEKKIPLIMNAQNEISKELLPSYESLPQHLKACFLYMGVFPQNHEIPTSKLIKLWFSEGFLEPNASQTFDDFASKCLKELVERSMVMEKQKGSNLTTSKICSLHSVYWHLSCNVARRTKCFIALDDYLDNNDLKESAKSQRRLCIRISTLLGNKDVYNVMASMSALHALLCTGRPHPYPMRLCFSSRFLRVLETLAIRFYEFPVEVVQLIHLRYLSLTCDGDVPSSISKLLNLQFFIIRQHLSIIRNSRNSSNLPKNIWDMRELKHLQVSGSTLPDPDSGALLPNLTSLLEVSVHSCTTMVLKRIPNLKKLGIQIELSPGEKGIPFHNLNSVSSLCKLESLKCVVVNPELGPGAVVPPAPLSMFPPSLKKLSLSGLGYSWEHMGIIGKLPNLEVLKLRCYAFQGAFWEIGYSDFPKLKFLSIEDSDLVHLDFKMPCIYNLQCLSIKHCYELEHLPSSLNGRVDKLEVIDCSLFAENWAKQMKEDSWEIRRLKTLGLFLQSSWNDESLN